MNATLTGYLKLHAEGYGDDVWLRDRAGDGFAEWTWSRALSEIESMGAYLEEAFGHRTNMAILSRNRAHWFLADFAIIASGNVTIPIFTTLPAATARYVLDFSETKVLFLGEAENWPIVREILPADVVLIALPGVEPDVSHLRWDDLVTDAAGAAPGYECKSGELVSLIFTSGTTGVPKGVMQTHDSSVLPTARIRSSFRIRENPRFLSYLPLSHIGERHLVEFHSLLRKGVVTFNETLPTLIRDLQEARPNFFFGAPRVWEQLQQIIIGQFGSQEAIDRALTDDRQATGATVVATLGLQDVDYCLTAAAPIPPALIEWYENFGLSLLEGYGQTEAMGLIANTKTDRRVGAIGKPAPGVEFRLSEQDELLVRAEGLSPGYYKMPEQTAELIRDGWWHTGDKARVDGDGFIYLTGRVKDYFKTIHGKFVAPVPIESAFADNECTEQLCLLGRGYSKTVVVCVLTARAYESRRDELESTLREQVDRINSAVDKHARIGAVIVAAEGWTIENEMLTPTLKIRREKVEARFGERARELAHEAAERGDVLVEWARL